MASDAHHSAAATTNRKNNDYRLTNSRAIKSAIAFGLNKAKDRRWRRQIDNKHTLPPKKTLTSTTMARDINTPNNHRQAATSPYRDYFHAAEDKETNSLIAKGTWTIEQPKHRVTVIKGAFIYRVKELETGLVEQFKARYVAKGYSQIPGIHYKESFAPVASATAIRAILLTALEYNWPLHHVDISTAFLNAKIEEGVEIYIQPPPTIQLQPGEYLRLRRGLYGLVQGSALWAKLLNKTLQNLGFTCNRADASVYTRTNTLGTVHCATVVDDFAITGTSEAAITKFKSEIACVWDCTDFGQLDWYIQLSVKRNRSTGHMTISQQTYIEKMMHRYHQIDPDLTYRPYDTPMDSSQAGRLSQLMCPSSPSEQAFMDAREYRGLLGSLQYARHTRPDILQAVSECAKYQTNPGPKHYAAAIRILHYLNHTKHHRIVWRSTNKKTTEPWTLTVHVDADWANDPDNRRSRSGYVIKANGNVISYGTGLQPKCASSTPVAEYVALASAVKETIYVQQLMAELRIPIQYPIVIHEDNRTCIHITKNPAAPRKTRHVDIRYHFVRDYQLDGIIDVIYINSQINTADIFTKALPRPAFQRLRKDLISDEELPPEPN
jgi:hypothetical protein